MTKRIISMILAAMLAFCLPAITASAESVEPQLMVGAAMRDITPTAENGLVPIEYVGTGDMGSYLEGVVDPIYTRVIALSDGTETALIICTDSGKGPCGYQFAPLLAEHAGIPVENVFYTTTHAHSVPEIKRPIDMDLDINDTSINTLDRWAKLTYLQMIDAIDEAMAEMRPATVGIGYAESYINVNRLRKFTMADGKSFVGQGYNGAGFSDKTLVAIEFDDLEGKPIAFLTNYAVHATVMYGNPLSGRNCGISADIPGYVATALEKKYEGAVALWTSGAAGDQNPIIATGTMSPNPVTGAPYMLIQKTVNTEMLAHLGDIQSADVATALASITEKKSNVDIACGYAGTTIPSETTENGEFGVQLQLLRIGDIALVGHGGELYNSLGVYMKENSPLEHTIVVNHTWTHEEQNLAYHPDDDAIANGSYHNTTLYKPGYLKEALSTLTNQLINESK